MRNQEKWMSLICCCLSKVVKKEELWSSQGVKSQLQCLMVGMEIESMHKVCLKLAMTMIGRLQLTHHHGKGLVSAECLSIFNSTLLLTWLTPPWLYLGAFVSMIDSLVIHWKIQIIFLKMWTTNKISHFSLCWGQWIISIMYCGHLWHKIYNCICQQEWNLRTLLFWFEMTFGFQRDGQRQSQRRCNHLWQRCSKDELNEEEENAKRSWLYSHSSGDHKFACTYVWSCVSARWKRHKGLQLERVTRSRFRCIWQ